MIEKKFLQKLSALDTKRFPQSLRIRALYKGQLSLDWCFGEEYKYYDVASLTKILFTNSCWMHQTTKKPELLENSLGDYLAVPGFESLKLKSLFQHISGFPWWLDWYKSLAPGTKENWNYLKQWEKMDSLFSTVKRLPVEKSVYSDIDYFALGLVLKSFYQGDLLAPWRELREKFQMEGSFFSVNNVCPVSVEEVAPTEFCNWRNQQLQGVVDDENAFALGGVSTHAGLFSTMEDLSRWSLKLREILLGKEGEYFSSEVAKEFVKRQIPVELGDWGLGFMLPTEGKASCGKYFSSKSFGHTGFTGTSIWNDPEKDLIVIVLSNRVYPTRENKDFVPLRPILHDLIYESHFC